MTVTHHLRVHRSDEPLAREGQLAWRIADWLISRRGYDPARLVRDYSMAISNTITPTSRPRSTAPPT